MIPRMDGLPGELCFKIFHLLDHQSLAAAPQGSLAAFDQTPLLLLMSTSYYQLLYQKSSVTSYVAMASFLVLPSSAVKKNPLLLMLSWHFLFFFCSIIQSLRWPELPKL